MVRYREVLRPKMFCAGSVTLPKNVEALIVVKGCTDLVEFWR